MNVQVTDLFKKRGKQFDFQTRANDMNELIKRLIETGNAKLAEYSIELDEFGTASMVFLEYMLERITTECSKSNIAMS